MRSSAVWPTKQKNKTKRSAAAMIRDASGPTLRTKPQLQPVPATMDASLAVAYYPNHGDNTLSLRYHIRAPVDVHDFLCPKPAWVLSRDESRRKIYPFHCAATGDCRSCGSSRYFSARAGRWHMDRCQ